MYLSNWTELVWFVMCWIKSRSRRVSNLYIELIISYYITFPYFFPPSFLFTPLRPCYLEPNPPTSPHLASFLPSFAAVSLLGGVGRWVDIDSGLLIVGGFHSFFITMILMSRNVDTDMKKKTKQKKKKKKKKAEKKKKKKKSGEGEIEKKRKEGSPHCDWPQLIYRNRNRNRKLRTKIRIGRIRIK